MKTVAEPIKEGRQVIRVELEPSEIVQFSQNFYMGMAQNHGLRPEAGMSARQICERDIDADELGRTLSEMVVRRAAPAVLDQVGIDTVGMPDFGCHGYASPDYPYSFELIVAVKPKMELSSYEPVTLPLVKAAVDEAEIDGFISQIAHAHPETVEDPQVTEIVEGGLVRLALSTSRDGQPFEGLSFDGRDYKLGLGNMPESFDRGIVGMKLGEVRNISFKSFVAGQNAQFETQVTFISGMREEPATVTDEWVNKNIKGASTVAALRILVSKELEKQAQKNAGNYEKFLAAEQIAQRLTTSVPDAAFLAQFEALSQGFEAQLEQEGKTLDDYLSASGMTNDDLSKQFLSQAREQLRQGLALDAMADHKGIKLTHAEFMEYLDSFSQGQHELVEKSLKADGGLRAAQETALRLKVNEWLVQNAQREASAE